MIYLLISLLWGFAEATLFFIVPDVIITFVALSSVKHSILSSFFAGIGALFGGVIMYKWGRKNPDYAINIISKTPAVSLRMIEGVENQIKNKGYLSLFIGAFTGRPYKIYATLAGKLNLPLFTFLIISFPARILRFLLLGIIVGLISMYASSFLPYRTLVTIHISGWVIFYLFFFYKMK